MTLGAGMPEEEKGSSLVDQIVAKAIEGLSQDPAFDGAVLERLKSLVGANGLVDAEKVASTLPNWRRPIATVLNVKRNERFPAESYRTNGSRV